MWNKIVLENNKLQDVITFYLDGNSVNKMSKEFKISRKALHRILTENGIKIRGIKESTVLAGKRKEKKIASQKVIDEIMTGKSGMRVARENGISYRVFNYRLNLAGIKLSEISYCSQYSVDETAFDVITEESAYWIGFLMADGCVQFLPKYKYNLCLGLRMLDIEHIEKFRKFLKAERPAHIDKKRGIVSFAIGSKRLCEAVMKFGIIPRKTKVAKVVGLEMNRHFWRGVVDGDGSVYKHRNSYLLNLSGSEFLLSQFRDFVRSHFTDYKASVRNGHYCYTITVGIKVIELLYKDCTIALDRKLAKANYFIAETKKKEAGRN